MSNNTGTQGTHLGHVNLAMSLLDSKFSMRTTTRGVSVTMLTMLMKRKYSAHSRLVTHNILNMTPSARACQMTYVMGTVTVECHGLLAGTSTTLQRTMLVAVRQQSRGLAPSTRLRK